MPHCIIEYTSPIAAQVAPDVLVKTVHDSVRQSGLFITSHIKTRAIAYPHYQVGDADSGFIHITIRLHQGRSTPQKQQLSQAVVACLVELLPQQVSITAEIIDIDTATYAKQSV